MKLTFGILFLILLILATVFRPKPRVREVADSKPAVMDQKKSAAQPIENPANHAQAKLDVVAPISGAVTTVAVPTPAPELTEIERWHKEVAEPSFLGKMVAHADQVRMPAGLMPSAESRPDRLVEELITPDGTKYERVDTGGLLIESIKSEFESFSRVYWKASGKYKLIRWWHDEESHYAQYDINGLLEIRGARKNGCHYSYFWFKDQFVSDFICN